MLRLRIGALCVLAMILGTVVGCTDDGGAAPAGDDAATDGSTPRYCPTESGYPGDESCLEPPDPDEGWQAHFGPSDYDDPDAVRPFVISPGASITDCVFVKTPNTEDAWVGENHTRLRPSPGTTLILFVDAADHPGGLGPCASAGGRLWAGAGAAGAEGFDSPPEGGPAPELAGLAAKLPGRSQGALQLHSENATEEPMLREAWMNLLWRDAADVTGSIGPLFLLAGLGGNVPARSTRMWQGMALVPHDLSLPVLAPHYHSHTTRFAVWKVVGAVTAPPGGDAGGSIGGDAGPPLADGGSPPPAGWGTGERTRLLEVYQWPQEVIWFTSIHTNSEPDLATRRGGAVSGPVELLAGEHLAWECEIVNDLDTPLVFGNDLSTAEMCNLFGIFTPNDENVTWQAFNF